MEKRTIIAVVLSILVIFGVSTINTIFFPSKPLPEKPVETALVNTNETVESKTSPVLTDTSKVINTTDNSNLVQPEIVINAPTSEQQYTISNNLIDAVFTNKGGELVSYKLKKHLTNGEPVQMLLKGSDGSNAFAHSWGDLSVKPEKELMNVFQLNDSTIEFSRTYYIKNASGLLVPYVFKKQFSFKPNEYVFELKILVENSVNEFVNLNTNGFAYTLQFGPQIGPEFQSFGQYAEYRKYYYRSNNQKKDAKVAAKNITSVADRVSWSSIIGKYFTFIAIPDATDYKIAYSTVPVSGLVESSTMYLQRPFIKSAKSTDVYYFYLGPKTVDSLAKYNSKSDNSYGFSDLKLDENIDFDIWLGWLESILKLVLQVFQSVINNWGLSIILLTILVKVLVFPLTHKGSEATARMAELQPKMKELQDKHKNNPQKLNQEMAEFYKKEGYNPLSGCMPLLIQFPLIIAMFNLFNNHFELRGAMFIPGWIPDLSAPESIFNFAPLNIPFIGSDLRLLPIIYVASQLLYGKFTQTPDQQSNSQMKIIMYVMPLVFFFIFYSAPSGLLVYWIATNVLTIVQQMIINKMIARKKLKKSK